MRNPLSIFDIIFCLQFAIGNSMLPTFGKYNLIRIKKQKKYNIGEIISLKTHDGIYHCHRIVSIDDNFVTTKGDNLLMQEYEVEVPIKNIEGIASLIWKLK